MSRMIDRIFYNPGENYSCGHPPYPSEISTLKPPRPPPRILISSRVTRIYVIISDWWVSLTRVTIGPILMCV